jgi:hypothetical protein
MTRAEEIRNLKTKHDTPPDLTPKTPKVVVSLFDGAGTIWQILDKIGMTPEYRFSCEANPYQIALLGARYGYRNPPEWLKEAHPKENGYENPNGLIHLGAILPGGKFEHEGKQYTCQEMVDLHTGIKDTPVGMFVGGPVCNSNSLLAHVDSSAEDATSNTAGDFYVAAAKSVRAKNPDVKMVVENVRNTGKNANNYNSKVMDAFGVKDNPYYNTAEEDYTYKDEHGIEQKGKRTVTDVNNKAGLNERVPQWYNVNTPVEHVMNRIRSIWANYRLTPEVYDKVVQELRAGKDTETPDYSVFGDEGWRPIRGINLGTITGNSGIDKDQAATLQEHISLMDAAGTVLARHDDNGAYIITADGRPGIIANRMPKLSKKIIEGAVDSIDDPVYGKILLWAAPVSKKDPTIRRPTLPRTHLERGKPYDVRFPTLDEGDELMWGTHDLARVPKHVDKYIQQHADLYPEFMRYYYTKKGEKKRKSQKHNKKAIRYSQGASWNIHTLLPIIRALLESKQKIDPELGYKKGGYVEPPLASRIKALSRF